MKYFTETSNAKEEIYIRGQKCYNKKAQLKHTSLNINE